MDFDFSDDQEQLRDAVRKYVDKGYTFERRRTIEKAGGFDRTAYTELAELGLTGLYVPEDDGGMGAEAEDQGRAACTAGYCRCHWPLTSRTTAGRSPGRPSDSQRPASWLSVMVRERTRPASMPACVAHWRMRASSWRLPTM